MPEFAAMLAQQRPGEIAIRDSQCMLTWEELDATLNRVANGILAANLPTDSRVAVFAENAVQTGLAHLGGLLAGVSTVPVNFHLTADEVAYILADSGSRIVFVDDHTVDRGTAAAAAVGGLTVIGWGGSASSHSKVADWNKWLADQSAEMPPDDLPPRPHLLYTSGTTGRPKGTELPPTMFAGGATISEHVRNMAQDQLAQAGNHLVVGPLYHTGPLSGFRMLAAGVPCVVLGRFDAKATLAAIQQYRIGCSVMVPTHFIRLLALSEDIRASYDVSSLRLVAHTGAACPVEVKRAMIDWWGPVLYEAYGATEVGTTCAITSQEWLEHPGSVGRALPPFEAVVLDDDGSVLPPGTPGRLYFRDTTGRGVRYHNNPDASAAAHIAPGVFSLGEIGYLDEDGYVYITDRFSDMVVSGGVNIYPAEAEQVLMTHPAVADVACIGIPDPEMGEQLIALIVPENDIPAPDPDDLVTYCRGRLAGYKCPRRVDVVTSIGRTTMGKVNKARLRDHYLATRADEDKEAMST